MVERNREQLLASGVKDPNKIFRLLKTLQPGRGGDGVAVLVGEGVDWGMSVLHECLVAFVGWSR
eukprot:32130-Eustigmatos_ZCMA.PRE.1